MNEKYFWIYGKHSVLAALSNPERRVKNIFVTDLKNINYKNKSIIKLVEPKKISKLFYPQQVSHQNIAAEIQKLPSENIQDIINDNAQKKILILDGITDPHNIGAIIRSAAAFNVNVIVVKKRIFDSCNPAMYKASCGAIEKVRIIESTNLNDTIKILKKNNFWIYGLTSKSNIIFSKKILNEKNVFIFGSEENGISNLLQKNCDYLTKINMSNSIESLNVSNAVAVILHETFY
jgi:23S rRNA (guanosine2251-2'-O)-methyltransferase